MLKAFRLADPETGLWCSRCLLPSAARVISLLFDGGRPAAILVGRVCPEHGGFEHDREREDAA